MKNLWTSRAYAVFAAGALLLLGVSAATAQLSTDKSGFLSDYSRLAPDPNDPDARLVYANPDYAETGFERVYAEDLAFVVYPEAATVQMSRERAAKLLHLMGRFGDLVGTALKQQGIRQIEKPEAGALHCRWAMTNLSRAPIASELLPQAMEMGVFSREGRRGMAVEVECLDGEGGEQVFAEIEADRGGTAEADFTSWEGVEERIDRTASELAAGILQATKKRRSKN